MRLRTLWSVSLIPMLVFVTRTAVASDWQLVSNGKESKVYVDTESLGHHGRYVKAWFLWDYASQQKDQIFPDQRFLSQKILWYISCSEKTAAQIQLLSYTGKAGDGDVVTRRITPIGLAQFEDVVPDSVGQILVNYVCKREGAKK